MKMRGKDTEDGGRGGGEAAAEGNSDTEAEGELAPKRGE